MAKVDRRIQRTHQALAEALIALSLERGYDAVSVKDITDQANVAYITFFRHFKDKSDILMMMLDEMAEEIEHIAHEGAAFSHAHEGRLMFEYVQAKDDFYRVILSDQGSVAVRKRAIKQLSRLIRQHVGQHRTDADAVAIPADLAAHHVASSLLALIEWWMENGMPYTPEYMGEIYAQLIVAPALASV